MERRWSRKAATTICQWAVCERAAICQPPAHVEIVGMVRTLTWSLDELTLVPVVRHALYKALSEVCLIKRVNDIAVAWFTGQTVELLASTSFQNLSQKLRRHRTPIVIDMTWCDSFLLVLTR